MATSSILGRRIFLAAASRATQRTVQTTSLRAASAAIATQQATYNSYGHSDESPNLLSKFGLLAAGALATTAAMTEHQTNKSAKCCGIAGVVGAKGDARDYLIEGLTILKNRGYDSAGIATMDENNPAMVSAPSYIKMYSDLVCTHLVV